MFNYIGISFAFIFSCTTLTCVCIGPIFAVVVLGYMYYSQWPICCSIFLLGYLTTLVLTIKMLKNSNKSNSTAADCIFICWVPSLWPVLMILFVIDLIIKRIKPKFKDFINWVYKD